MNRHRLINRPRRTHTALEVHGKQGQYLAFIYHYSLFNRCAPAEFDIQTYFRVLAPTVHQMIVTLDRKGFITRTPGQGRSTVLKPTKDQLPELKAVV